MSESPAPTVAAAVQTQKRPLEEPSSPNSTSDQPDAKRPARVKPEETDETTAPVTEPSPSKSTLPVKPEPIDDPVAADAAAALSHGQAPTQEPAYTSASVAGATAASPPPQDESQFLHLRSVITSAEAATIIGKGGENVNQIRRLSGAKCTVSEYIRGAVERVLTVSGMVDAVAKAFGLIIRTLNEESLESPSTAQSKTYPLRLLIPHILTGPIIGKAGQRIREIQEASGARLNASDQCLPLSSERSLVVLGVADAVHIAAYYIGSTLVEQLTERYGGPAASAYASRNGGAAAVVGGMQIVPYVPQHAGGQWGAADARRQTSQNGRGPMPPRYPMQQGYGQPPSHGAPHQRPQPPMHMGAGSPHAVAYPGPGPQAPSPYGAQPPIPHVGGYGAPQPGQPPAAHGMPMGGSQAITQQIFIPNDMVGAIIGKGGSKINEIRQLSGSVIKINEPQDNSPERLVSITGTQECNQMALYMLYNKLGKTLSIRY